MGSRRIIGLSGSLSSTSRTRTVVLDAVQRIAGIANGLPEIIDVAELAGLGNLRSRADAAPEVEAALQAVETADLLVVGTPVYKGSYTGLLKHFIDFIDYRALAGLPVGLIASGGSERHALVVEHQLRPLFGFFQARTLPTGLFFTDRDIENGKLISDAIEDRLSQLIAEAADTLRAPARQSAAA
jgi:FMN reductase